MRPYAGPLLHLWQVPQSPFSLFLKIKIISLYSTFKSRSFFSFLFSSRRFLCLAEERGGKCPFSLAPTSWFFSSGHSFGRSFPGLGDPFLVLHFVTGFRASLFSFLFYSASFPASFHSLPLPPPSFSLHRRPPEAKTPSKGTEN